MSTGELVKASKFPDPLRREDTDILPTLFGAGYGNYQADKKNFILSFLIHTLAAILLLTSGYWMVQHKQEIKLQVANLVTDISPYILPPSATKAGGGGGGGDRDKLQAPKG
ncbi:MAG TPA: hypothetical protein VK473_14220, partial [Terriglobales bacterium]|nr:hypothetical protein [Terriglobales bacterium]